MDTLGEVALAYARDFGWRVLPVRPRSKVPALADWPRMATKDPATVEEWWTNGYAGFGIGIATGSESGLMVVDVDNGPGKFGDDTLDALGPLPDTPTVLTPGGGRHLYFRWPGFNPVHDALGPWIDVQGEGRFVVAPPSVHPNGRTYAWEHSLRPSVVPMTGLPSLVTPTAEPGASAGSERDPRFAEIFSAAGWAVARVDNKGQAHWTRPGKSPREGSSATEYPYPDAHATIYTTSVPGVPVGEPLGPVRLAQLLGVDCVGALVAPGTTLEDADDEQRLRPVTVHELLSSGEPEYDWHVPNLLERMDRFTLTGDEGYGKSTFLRQMGLGGTLGVNTLSSSWFADSHKPLTVLLVDLENSERQLRREFAKLIDHVPETLAGRVGEALDRFHLVSKPDGLVLDSERDTYGDRTWLDALVAEVGAELLILGPIYKMIDGDPTEEAPNRNLAKWLDRLRVRHGVTLLLEAHSPHGEIRPYGWSGWKRWPEFGLHLDRDGRLTHWRGQRDERAWPARLSRAGAETSSRRWLWTPDLGNNTEAPSDPAEDAVAACRVVVIRVLHKAPRPLTKNEVVDRSARRKASVWAALARLVDEGMVVEVPLTVERSNGRPYSATGHCLPEDRARFNVVPEFPAPRESEHGNTFDFGDAEAPA